MKIVAIIQARLDSTRLLGKVLKDIEGKPMLDHIIKRLKESKLINQTIVATSEESSDDPINNFCVQNGIECFRGSKDDVLDRFYQAAKEFNCNTNDIVVRITGDSPLIDPVVTDQTIQYYLDNKEKFDYVSNVNPPTFPDGLDTEVFSFEILEEVWKSADKKYQREHVTPFIVESEKYRKGNFVNDKDLSHLRWCVDQEEDLLFVKKICEKLYCDRNIFTMEEVLCLLDKEPELLSINDGIGRNEGFLKSLSEENVDASQFKNYFKKGLIDKESKMKKLCVKDLRSPNMNIIIEGYAIIIKPITKNEINERYVSWLNNQDINKYLEVRHKKQSIDSIVRYVNEHRSKPNCELFAIFTKKNKIHIGNISIDCDLNNRNATYGLIIGDKNAQMLGLGAEATVLMIEFLFRNLNILKVCAGDIDGNELALKLHESLGFKKEGVLRQHYILSSGKVCDAYPIAILRNEWLVTCTKYKSLLKHMNIKINVKTTNENETETEKIIQAIFNAVDEINLPFSEEQKLQKDINTNLFGNLDSLGLVNFIVEVEQNIEKAFNVSISLADEQIMSTECNPLTNIKTLVDYIDKLLKEINNE